jgi:hypothetical protein
MIATIAVAIVALSIFLPATVRASSSSAYGSKVKLAGSLHFAFETQACVAQNPNCSPSVEVTYMTALDGSNYRLIGVRTSYLDNTKVVVTGLLLAPSGSSGLLSPALIFAGTIDVMSLLAHCERHLG